MSAVRSALLTTSVTEALSASLAEVVDCVGPGCRVSGWAQAPSKRRVRYRILGRRTNGLARYVHAAASWRGNPLIRPCLTAPATSRSYLVTRRPEPARIGPAASNGNWRPARGRNVVKNESVVSRRSRCARGAPGLKPATNARGVSSVLRTERIPQIHLLARDNCLNKDENYCGKHNDRPRRV